MAAERNGVSIRDQIVPAQSVRAFADAVRKIGASSVECAVGIDGTVGSLDVNLTGANGGKMLGQRCDTERICITALLLPTDFSEESADSHVQWAARMVEVAAELDIPVVRIDPWTAAKGLAPEAIVANVVRCTRRILEQTSSCLVDLGLENHGSVFNDPRILDQVLSDVSDDRFGLTLDTGNLYWRGHTVEEVYELIERYAPRAKHTHIKNINYPPELARRRREVGFEYKKYCCPLADGNLDLGRIVQILRGQGYQRALCVEDESLFKVPEDEKLDVLRRDVQTLRECIAPA